MKLTKLLGAAAFALILTAAPTVFAVDTLSSEIARDEARAAAAVDRTDAAIRSEIAADRAAADAAVGTVDSRIAADRIAAANTADRAVDRAVTETRYAADTTAANIEYGARRAWPWVLGLLALGGLIYWATRRPRATYVPPVDRTVVDRTVADTPCTRRATGTYTR